uniref:Uncharacterized protein n=1 Tax=Caenorhabditis tropicalis TaxID=1561998 RepID=A0A1I7TJP8_9PELO
MSDATCPIADAPHKQGIKFLACEAESIFVSWSSYHSHPPRHRSSHSNPLVLHTTVLWRPIVMQTNTEMLRTVCTIRPSSSRTVLRLRLSSV